MGDKESHDLNSVLRILKKKGFYEILLFIKKKECVGYNQILRHVETQKIASRAAMNTAVTRFEDLGLLDKAVSSDNRPIRTYYTVNERGLSIIRHLQEIEKIMLKGHKSAGD